MSHTWSLCTALALYVALAGASACSAPDEREAVAPYPRSRLIDSVAWDFGSAIQLAPGSDLWPITWAADDNLYTSWGDGGGFGGTNSDGRVSLGFARIEGSPPDIRATNIWGGKDALSSPSFGGKTAGMLAVDSVLYSWINTQDTSVPDFRLAWSYDYGITWTLSEWSVSSAGFAPSTFLNTGRGHANAPDGFIYAYGGQWGHSPDVYLVRTSLEGTYEFGSYDFFTGLDADGEASWSRDSSYRTPVFSDKNLARTLNGAFVASVVWIKGLNRFILTVAHGGAGGLGIFDAPNPWGPWSTVEYYEDWYGAGDADALVYSIPLKWVRDEGRNFWIVYSSTGRLDGFNAVAGRFVLRHDGDQ